MKNKMTQSEAQKALLPCPFCGANAWEDEVAYGQFINVCCSNEECDLASIAMTKFTWNTRQALSSADVSVGDVREALKIADARGDEVKELDFGNVFWACGVLANNLRASTQKPDVSGLLSALETISGCGLFMTPRQMEQTAQKALSEYKNGGK